MLTDRSVDWYTVLGVTPTEDTTLSFAFFRWVGYQTSTQGNVRETRSDQGSGSMGQQVGGIFRGIPSGGPSSTFSRFSGGALRHTPTQRGHRYLRR